MSGAVLSRAPDEAGQAPERRAPARGEVPLLSAAGLVKHFPLRRGLAAFGQPRRAVRAVDGISFDVRAGETLALVGESGCGKSTVGRLILRLLEPTAGSLRYDGRDITHLPERRMRPLRRELQVVFQDPFASLNPRMTVGEVLAEPLAVHGIARGRERQERVRELLAMVGLSPHHAPRYPHEFSGGQRQRVAIARALASGPKLVVGDEPVSALDVSIQAQIINLLEDLQRRLGLTLVMISHDLAVVRHMSDRVAVMYLGRIVEIADKASLFAEPRHPYTQALMAAAPLPDPAARRDRVVLGGDVPSPVNPPSGCRFRTRCPHAQERCRLEDPALAADDGHLVACHFWKEIEPPARVARAATGGALPYQRRVDLFRRRQAARGAAADTMRGTGAA